MKYAEVKISSIAKFINGFPFKPEHWENDGYPIIRIQNLTDQSKPFNKTMIDVPNKYLVQKGDILVSWSATIDVFEWAREDALLNQHIFKVEFDPLKVDKSYFKIALRKTIRDLTKYAHGSTMKHVVKGDFDSHFIPLPQLNDQKRIAHLLGKVERLIAQRKQHLRQLDDLLKSVFLEMFGDPVRNEKEWENRQLQELCASPKDIKCGPFGTQLGKSEFKKIGIAVWGIPQINSEFSIPPRDFVTQEKASELEEYSVRHNDIVMSRKGTVGKCSLYPPTMPPGIMHSDVLRIRADCTETNPVYLCWQLRISRNVERQIANVSSGAIMAGINVGKLKSITVLAPPIFLQNEFSSIVEKVENLKSRYQQSLTDLEALYGALSQKAFKGELDLSRVPLV